MRRGLAGAALIALVSAACGRATTASAGTGRSPAVDGAPSSHESVGSHPSASSGTPTGPVTSAIAAPPGRCHASDLRATLGTSRPVLPGSEQRTVPLVLTNTSITTCTLSGHPGFTLDGPESDGMSSYSPIGQQATPTLVTLAPGSSAHAMFTFLPGPDVCDAGTPWVPTRVRTIPPGGTTPLSLAWTGGSVDNCQGGATHPGTYLGVVEPGAS